MKDLVARIHTIQGHLRAVERLVASGRSLEACAQLQAVRGALTEITILTSQFHAERCLSGKGSPSEVMELVDLARASLAARSPFTRDRTI